MSATKTTTGTCDKCGAQGGTCDKCGAQGVICDNAEADGKWSLVIEHEGDQSFSDRGDDEAAKSAALAQILTGDYDDGDEAVAWIKRGDATYRLDLTVGDRAKWTRS